MERRTPASRRPPWRPLLVRLHRWLGLATAAFLAVAGSTGAIIAWDHELDAWLNPAFHRASSGPTARVDTRVALALAARLEARDPRLRVTYLPLSAAPGDTLLLSVAPRFDPRAQRPYEPGFDQLALDPATGRIQARRDWGAASLARENLLPFLYRLHYSLHVPDGFGLETGVLLMGCVALAWLLDALVALTISFPSPRNWRKSLAFRWRRGGGARVFDVHRSGGVWLWPLLAVLALTAVSMNLPNEVVRPAVTLFSPLTPDPFETRTGLTPREPVVDRARILSVANPLARGLGVRQPAGAIFYSPEAGLYGVGYFDAGDDHGDSGLGNAWLYFDARDASPAGMRLPGRGTAGDVFMQAQFPLHSGRILGLPGRALVAALGLAVTVLCGTGVALWIRRRAARRRSAALRACESAGLR